MPKYEAIFAATVRCFGCITVEAENAAAARQRFREIADEVKQDKEFIATWFKFDPEFDVVQNVEFLEDADVKIDRRWSVVEGGRED
jgi:hypothetical protein